MGLDRGDRDYLRGGALVGPAAAHSPAHLLHRKAVPELDTHHVGTYRHGVRLRGLRVADRAGPRGAAEYPESLAALERQDLRVAGYRVYGNDHAAALPDERQLLFRLL